VSASSIYPLRTRAAMTMVLVDPAADPAALPLPGIVEVLRQTIQTELDDLSWVLHVVWDVGLPPPTTPPTQIRVPLGLPNMTVFVHDELQRFCDEWGIAFDEVLIETSGVNPDGSRDAELWWAMQGLTCTSSVNYLIRDPEQWNQLPATLGLLPASVNAQAVALLGPMPEAHLVQTLLIELSQILGSPDPANEAQLWFQAAAATQRFRRWRRRWVAVVSQIYSSTRFKPKPWSLDAIRLRFEADPSVVVPLNQTNVDSFGRWARSITDRRVGVAIGGAGAQSYVGIPFIAQLRDAGVPIDILSGSSTGAFIGAFYAALGNKGLTRMLFNSNTIGWGVFFALVDNIPLTWWLSWATEFVDLSELAQPTITVSSIAQTGEPYHQTSGLAGKGLMASGSLPPFVATYIGNTRLLDGGPTQDLPTAILNAAGAELVIAAQAVPKVQSFPRLPDQVPVPYFKKWALSLNPLLRGFDAYRSYLMLYRQAAMGEEQYADVFYNATTKFSSAGSWYAGPRIAHEAANSQALQDAIAQAKLEWEALLEDAPGRARINRGTNQVEVGPAVHLGFELDPSVIWRLTPHAEQLLEDIGRYVANFATSLNVTLVNVPPPNAIDYGPLFETASGLLGAQINYIPVIVPTVPPSFSLEIVP
jgi:predicted acylesterase/phospholipase RssA